MFAFSVLFLSLCWVLFLSFISQSSSGIFVFPIGCVKGLRSKAILEEKVERRECGSHGRRRKRRRSVVRGGKEGKEERGPGGRGWRGL